MNSLGTLCAVVFVAGIASADTDAWRLKTKDVLLAQNSCPGCQRRLHDCLGRCSGSIPGVQACYAEKNRRVGQFCR